MSPEVSGRMVGAQGVKTGPQWPGWLVVGAAARREATMGKKGTLTYETYCEKQFGTGSMAVRSRWTGARRVGHTSLM